MKLINIVINFSKIKQKINERINFNNRLFSKIKNLRIKEKLKSKIDFFSTLELTEITQKIKEARKRRASYDGGCTER